MNEYLAATAWVKDEAPYLAEWIEFHLLQGFQKFYIYDNGSTDNTAEVLKPYVDLGIVEHRFYPPEVTHRKNFYVMWRTIKEFKGKHKWLFHHSIDEYMFSENSNKRVVDILRFLEDHSGVCVPWYMFNSSGHKTKKDGLVIERFDKYVEDENRHIKTIIQPDKTEDSAGNPHVYNFTQGQAVYVNHQPHNTSGRHGGACDNPHYLTKWLRINHYITMSKEEYETKMNKGLLDDSSENYKRAESDGMWKSLHPPKNTWLTDNSLSKYIPIVKQRLKERYGH